MTYNLENDNEVYLFSEQVKWLLDNNKICELKHVKKTRTLNQNSSLHLYFKLIADALNDNGETFHYFGISGKEFETRFTENIIKDYVFKPIMKTMFKIETTTKLDGKMINELIDVINKFMITKEIYIPFPSIQSLIDKQNSAL